MGNYLLMQFDIFNHQNATKRVPQTFQQEVLDILSATSLRKPFNTRRIRESILSRLHDLGWSDEVRVNPTSSKIDITSMRGNVGLCFQTGNMSRLYADILKLQTLFADKKIGAAICIVPKRIFAKSLNQNIVNYERFTNELDIFAKTITVPILVYGIQE
jgi:hypothetical protein